MASEREDVLAWIRLEFAYSTGFQLPAKLCERCLHQMFSYFSALESLEDILARGIHPCSHTLTAATVLDAALHSDAESVARLGEVIAEHGWNHTPGFLTDATDTDSPTIH